MKTEVGVMGGPTSRGAPRVADRPPKQGRASTDSPQCCQREHGPADALVSDRHPKM